MTIYKNNEGSLIIDEIVGNHLFTRVYQGYTKKEAIVKFKKEVKSLTYWDIRELPYIG